MAEAAHQAIPQITDVGPITPSSSQTAQYTREPIDSLRKMAKSQREEMLAILLEAASMEAGRIARRER
ncbi:MAG: hypothetical protein ACTHLR_12795 [Rhizomicrobium sp.]